jgi:hypothetical protein
MKEERLSLFITTTTSSILPSTLLRSGFYYCPHSLSPSLLLRKSDERKRKGKRCGSFFFHGHFQEGKQEEDDEIGRFDLVVQQPPPIPRKFHVLRNKKNVSPIHE